MSFKSIQSQKSCYQLYIYLPAKAVTPMKRATNKHKKNKNSLLRPSQLDSSKGYRAKCQWGKYHKKVFAKRYPPSIFQTLVFFLDPLGNVIPHISHTHTPWKSIDTPK